MRDIKEKNVIITLLLLIAFLELIRTAWLSDDAAITFRSVLNFIHGYGPTFNIDERVQAFTHPLWFLLLSGFTLINKNIFISAFMLSFFCSLLTLWLLLSRISTHLWGG